MPKIFSSTKRAYLAGFLDGDGSIYVRLKQNSGYRYGFQVAPYVVFFQSQKERRRFKKICFLLGMGYLRERNDGILEYVINRKEEIRNFLGQVKSHLILKRKQAELMLEILAKKEKIKTKADFNQLARLVDKFRELNYSKKRKRYKLTL
ncbi:hypothetical protein A2433_01210 [Candidatus Giovannonibacteria bacterium RIFOXYC1_FULL_48_8]|nr:MAG: hypothetical protein A2433_01210 [Candidatus Giovannonibacteria bacterium RIFOXYC1_FULL_48_8]